MGKFMPFLTGLITGSLLTFVVMGWVLIVRVHVEREAIVRAYQEAEQARLESVRAETQALLQEVEAHINNPSWLDAKRALEEARDFFEKQQKETDAQDPGEKE
jgi:hypothetical protein